MSVHQAFRRSPVPPQVAQQMQAATLPAPIRGLHLDENQAFMQPAGAIILDNWLPTLRGIKLRGGCKQWCALPETTPVISAFEYRSANVQQMFAANINKVYNVTAPGAPSLVASGRLSGNYSAAQMANASGDYLTVTNDAGDYAMRYDGTTWTLLNGGQITGPVGSPVVAGHGLTYVWKYRRRLFFIQGGSMNAWYLDNDAIGGLLKLVPLSGSATKGGYLLFGATWSLDAGDGIDDKCVFGTSEGELLIFTGTDPSDANNWRQEGRYQVAAPMGMNAHLAVGGDLLLETKDGIVPISQAISKDIEALQLSAITKPIAPLWQSEVASKTGQAWTMHRWEEFGGLFVALPGGTAGNWRCFVANTNTGAWCRITGWDAMCFMRLRADMFFGTQTGKIMQADFGGYDDGLPYVATMVGAWEMFQQPSMTVVWHQARAIFQATPGEPFIPQISAATDYNSIDLLQPPPAGLDPGGGDYWDQARWDISKWDQPTIPQRANATGWVSVGQTGYTHAPVVQVTVAQQAKPTVELISISATFERLGVNV